MTTNQNPDSRSGSETSDESLSKLEERARVVLQTSAEQLDGRTRSRLTQARHTALDANRPATKTNSWWLPAGGVAAAAVLAVMMSLNSANRAIDDGDTQLAMAPVDAIEIATAEDSLEFYRDVEFYAWLDTVLEDEPAEASGA